MYPKVLKKIKIIPLAEESFGVRSMCTSIETSDTKILLDAGSSLAPKRMGYPPHPQEYQALAECRKRINKTAEKSEIITISHYHFDHHTPSYTDWFTNWSSEETAKKYTKESLSSLKATDPWSTLAKDVEDGYSKKPEESPQKSWKLQTVKPSRSGIQK